MKQADEDIIAILTNPPLNTTPSLEPGNLKKNALFELATTLKRVDTIPEQKESKKKSPKTQFQSKITTRRNF